MLSKKVLLQPDLLQIKPKTLLPDIYYRAEEFPSSAVIQVAFCAMLSLKGSRDHSDMSLPRTALSSPWCGQGGAGGRGGGSSVGD